MRATCCWIGHHSLSAFVLLSVKPTVSAGPVVNSSIVQIMAFDPTLLFGGHKKPH